MKHLSRLLLPVLGATLSLSACSSNDTSSSSHPTTATQQHHGDTKKHDADDDRDDDEARSHPPRIGMTKAEVRARYGEPSSVNESGQGETWFYNPYGVSGLDFVPFYGGVHSMTKTRRGGSIVFGPNGRVRDFNWKAD